MPWLDCPALGEGWARLHALCGALAHSLDKANVITRTLFVGLAMVESNAIYLLVVAMVLFSF